MSQAPKIEISGGAATAAVPLEVRRLEAVDRLVWLGSNDPLLALFERIAIESAEIGLTEDVVTTELAAYNSERRA